MKILHIISGGDIGGAKTHVISLLKELQKEIHADLVCFMESDFTEDARDNHINIEVFVQKNRLDMSAVKKVIEKIEREKYDIIHCHGARANFIAMLLKLQCKLPIVTTIHSDYRLDFQGHFLKNLVFANINAFSLRFIDYYIGVSDSFKNMMLERGFSKDKVFSVYNGVSDEGITYMPKEEFYKKYQIPYGSGEIYVGIIGRFHPVKGHRIFLEGAAKAYKQNAKLRFLLAGDGEEREKLEKYAKDLGISDVTYFLGFMENAYDFFNAVDLNTLTSFSESFPYVILEGALLKKPTISSKVGGIQDMILDGKTGFTFEIGDSEGLSARILELANSREKSHRMGEGLHQLVKKNFLTKNMADRHIQIYREIIKNYHSK